MLKLTPAQYNGIRRWMYRNARPLDLARWQFHFENGSRETVLAALAAYQNADGGFGHALEADSWNPNSSSYTTAVAAAILEEIDFNEQGHPIVEGMLRYLECTPFFDGAHWPAVIPSNDAFPHAPWWSYNPNYKPEWGNTPSARLAGFVLKYGVKNTPLYHAAVEIAAVSVDRYLNGTDLDGKPYRDTYREMEIDGLRYLLPVLAEASLADTGDLSALKTALQQQVSAFIDRDPAKWTTYSRRPSGFILAPTSIFYPGNEDVVAAELDFLLTSFNPDGVWNIVWNWGAYPKEFAIAENWWKANLVLWYVGMLQKFGRIETVAG